MFEEEKRGIWLKIIGIIIISFLAAFLAFYCALELMLHRMFDPMYNVRRIEKIMNQQEKDFRRMEDKITENPFEPRMRPMLVNLVRENSEYKIIVDLRPLNENEKAVKIDFNDNIITITGEADKQTLTGEKIMNFSQTYYLDEKVDFSKMLKEKKGDKYIISLPFSQ